MKTSRQQRYRARQLAVQLDKLHINAIEVFGMGAPLSIAIRDTCQEALRTARAMDRRVIEGR